MIEFPILQPKQNKAIFCSDPGQKKPRNPKSQVSICYSEVDKPTSLGTVLQDFP